MTPAAALLSRAPERPRPEAALLPGIALALGRVHEACGRARRSFAAWLAGRCEGPVLWIAPGWAAEDLNPEGLLRFAAPERCLFAAPRRAEDVLWCAEEALRAGCVALVVAELPALPGLTPVRRLQLAAEAGAAEAGPVPAGLLLTPGAGGARGVETRWRMEPDHAPGRTAWRLERLRARQDPPRAWRVEDGAAGLAARPAPQDEDGD